MNYRQETYILLNKNAVEKLTPEVEKILYGSKSKNVTLADDAKVFTAQHLTLAEDAVVSEWLDTLDVYNDEVFEVIARGDDMDDIEHISNTLDTDRLSIDLRVSVDDIPLDEVVPEGGE